MFHRNGDRLIFQRSFTPISRAYRRASIRLSMTIRRSFCFHQLPTIFFSRSAMKMEPAGGYQKTKQLSLTEVNRVLTEAMSFCGANLLTRELVFNAVELANQ